MEHLGDHWLGILLAIVSTSVLGFIWYNPKTFGTAWMKSAKLTMEDAQKGNMALMMVGSMLMCGLIALYFSFWTHQGPEDPQKFLHGAFHTWKTSLLVVVPVMIANSLHEQRTFAGALVNIGYWVIAIALCAGMVFQFQPDPEPEPEAAMLIMDTVKNLV
jgi:MFS family permease